MIVAVITNQTFGATEEPRMDNNINNNNNRGIFVLKIDTEIHALALVSIVNHRQPFCSFTFF